MYYYEGLFFLNGHLLSIFQNYLWYTLPLNILCSDYSVTSNALMRSVGHRPETLPARAADRRHYQTVNVMRQQNQRYVNHVRVVNVHQYGQLPTGVW